MNRFNDQNSKMRVNFQQIGVLIQHIWSQYLALKNDPGSIFNPSQILCYSASNSLWQSSLTPNLLVWLVTSPTELLITYRRRGKYELSGAWKQILWVDEAHQFWRTANVREGKLWFQTCIALWPYPHMGKVRWGKHQYKKPNGWTVLSTSRDGKQSQKESPNIKSSFLEALRGLRRANNPT